jgi:ComF family protein
MSLLSWRSQVRNVKSHLVNLVFPPVCVCCRKVGAILCQGCIDQVKWVKEPICQDCGCTVARYSRQCNRCQKRPLPLKQIRAAVLFDKTIPETIHQLKYRNVFALAEPLGKLMAQAWPNWQINSDIVLPIPLHRQRQNKRGYNQSELLVKTFCRELSLPNNEQILLRTRKTPPQVGLNAEDRLKNVNGAFTVKNPQLIKGGNILLVDDVCTTGATLMAAAEVLLDAGAQTVSAYCLARAM